MIIVLSQKIDSNSSKFIIILKDTGIKFGLEILSFITKGTDMINLNDIILEQGK